MRCPKCGYTSFDDLERCKKCKKPMPPATATLTGTVLEATAPAYLLWGAAALTGQLGAKGGSPLFAASGGPRAEMQIPEPEEAAVESVAAPAEVDEATSPTVAEEPAEEMNLELGKVDISDLTAPEESAAPPEEEADFSLETLDVDDLGLGGGSAPSATPASGQYQPAAKTGTALDNFDVELDELLDVEESEKA